MTTDELIRCLGTIPVPDNVEEWLQPTEAVAPLPADSAFQRGVYATLAALGVLTLDGNPTSPMAYYFIRSLRAAVADEVLGAEAWQGTVDDDCSGIGAQLVRLLETHRLACCENPTPLRVVSAVTAVIKAQRNGEDVYLMQYDSKARQFQPIGGKQEAFDASIEEALTREVCEELAIANLHPGVDFQLRSLKENVLVDEVSATTQVLTRYYHSFFHLTDIRFPLNVDHMTRWLTSAELSARRSIDGLAITALFEDYLPGMLPTLDYSVLGEI